MDQGRILILGQTKESSYEIRNLLDNRRFELEIALNKEVGKTVLTSRRMHCLVLHTEVIGPEISDFFEFLEDHEISIPVLLLGEEAGSFRSRVVGQEQVECFEKPYAVDKLMSYIHSL